MSKLHNIAYVTPLIGAIRLGHMEERNGKRLPQKDDFFSVTGLHKENGSWVPHPLQEALMKKLPTNAEGKLREIPVKVLYVDPDMNSSERYEAYDIDQKRLVCAGDGEKAKRLEANGKIKDCDCPGDQYCEFGRKFRCGIYGRALFQVEGQSDSMGAFIMRTASYNAVNTLRSKLSGMHAMFGDKLPHIPLKLVLRTKSSPLSMNTAFYYADLEINGDMVQLALAATAKVNALQEAGINSAEFEKTMKELRENGAFEDPAETFDDREEFIHPEMFTFTGEGASAAPSIGGQAEGAQKVTVKPNRSFQKAPPARAETLAKVDEQVPPRHSEQFAGVEAVSLI